MAIPTAEQQINFLQKIQRLLEEGKFTSTYKFALLLSLVDLAVEKGDDTGEALEISVRDISEKMIWIYWKQAIPFPASESVESILYQNNDRQAAIVNAISSARNHSRGSLARAMADSDTSRTLITKVSATVKEMPLWKLQKINNELDDFLYEQAYTGSIITLRPGVTHNLRKFHGQIHNMVRGAWVRWVRKAKKNQSILGQSVDLEDFLFGTERFSLSQYVPVLEELQSGKCFYCGGRLAHSPEVDHFIPWIRYPVDLGHNFVLSHGSCNNSKRDFLADIPHLEQWVDRNCDHSDTLQSYFDDHALPYDLATSEKIGWWAYHQVEEVGGHVWSGKGDPVHGLNDAWRGVF